MQYSIELYNDENSEIKLTVALPVYNGERICWLALESLCKQEKINFDWELIIYEEVHKQSVFPHILQDYEDLLIKVGCKRIVFITNNIKVLLIDKWIEIGKNVSDTSKVFLLQAADCYSPKNRLHKTFDIIYKNNYDWYDQTKGYFYSFISDKVFLYDYSGLTNLNMGLKTDYIKTLPKSNILKGIDGYIFNHCVNILNKSGKKIKRYYDNNFYDDSIDTHGFNNISINREKYFTSKPNIFKKTNLNLDNLIIGNKIKNTDNVKYDLSIIISTFKNTQYLNDCFNSIIDSIGDKTVEVLVGIDSCLDSYNFILNKKFPNNFRFYFFEKNNGPYIVFNSLSKISKSDNIMFFASDDIMDKNMVDEMINALNSYSCFKPKYVDFKDGEKIDLNSKIFIGEGVFGIKKSIFEQMNGFEPWMCAADSDFMSRLYKKRYRLKISNKLNFYRRIHKNGLTSRKDTGMSSQLRANYAKMSKNKKGDGNPDRLHTRDFVLVDVNTIVVDTKNIEYYNHRKSVLDKVLNPAPRKVVGHQIKKKDPVINDRTEILYSSPKPIVRTIKPNKPDNRQDLINLKNNTNKSVHKQLFNTKPERRTGINPITIGGKSRT